MAADVRDKKHTLQGCLVDRYVATYHKELMILQQNSLLELKDKYYGIVFGDSISDPDVYKEFQKFVVVNSYFIDQTIRSNIKPVPVS